MLNTHEVTNQSPDYGGFNAYLADPVLQLITADLPEAAGAELTEHGLWAGSAEALRLGALANENLPELRTHDAKGNRIDTVEHHPSWHALLRKGISAGLNASIWQKDIASQGFQNRKRAAKLFMSAGVDCGHINPLTLTNSAIAALTANQTIFDQWQELIFSSQYDPSPKPAGSKAGVLLGLGVAEKQASSDINAVTTWAEPESGGLWRLRGHKWFLSAPMSDAFLLVAKTKDGLSTFLVPRLTQEGAVNGIYMQRLKSKVGNHSTATAEVEINGAIGHRIGDAGRGQSVINEMITLTRLDSALAAAGMMRASVAEAVHHCRYRKIQGQNLLKQPLMERVVADMALEVSAATALSMRLARAFDLAPQNEGEAAYARLMAPVVKYWVGKTAPGLAAEAMECTGGNGYMNSSNLARHYREAPVFSLWEGTGNNLCHEVIATISGNGSLLELVLERIGEDFGGANASKSVDVIRSAAKLAAQDPGSARILTEQLAYTAAAAELSRLRAGDTATAFMETRLGGLWRSTYGMLDNRHDAGKIVNINYPEIR